MTMIDAKRYTSGRIAVANLSASIDSLELRRVKGGTVADLLALSKLLFLRGDLLGRIVDHDRAELVAKKAVAFSPDFASTLYIRARLAERFHRFDEANALLDHALAAGYPTEEVDLERAALLQATGQYTEALFLRERLAKDDPGIHTIGALASLLAEMDHRAAAEMTYEAALDADEGTSPIPCGQLLFEWGVSAMRRGDLDRAEEIFVELDAILPQHIPGRGHRAEVALARGQFDLAAGLITPLLAIADDPEYRATYAEILAARGESKAAISEAQRAAATYERLLARRPEAYADHAAAFFMGIGNRPQLALDLALANFKLRDTPRSRSLLAKALRNAHRAAVEEGRMTSKHKVVVIGAGFAGMAVVRELRDSDAEVTLVDRNNHHLFQPFLFQVATSILEPAEIATPIRSLLNDMSNVRVEMREAKRIDLSRRVVVMSEGDDLAYDILVIATGATTSYFGHESEWAQHALGLKTLSDAIAARNRLLKAFERAEMESDPAKQTRETTVVVVGGGPTGVAITGTISEFVQRTLAADFRNIDPCQARIVLVEAGPRLLPAFSERHSSYATRALERAGVEVRLGVAVTHVDSAGVTIGEERIEASTVLWCTGVQGVPLAKTLGAPVTANGKVAVGNDFAVPGHPDCFVIGDAAHVVGADGRIVPGLASVAQHQGRYVGKLIAARLKGSAPPAPPEPFAPSKLATITRHVGIAEFGGRSINGFPAWLMWGLLHLRALAGGHSKLSILANWLRLLITYRRSARLIVEPCPTAEPGHYIGALRN